MTKLSPAAKKAAMTYKRRLIRSGAPANVARTRAGSLRVELRHEGNHHAAKNYISEAVALAKRYGPKGQARKVRNTLRAAEGLSVSPLPGGGHPNQGGRAPSSHTSTSSVKKLRA